jgi:transcriptional regulator with XRE-family HTH domain
MELTPKELRRLRLAARMTQAELARRVMLSDTAITLYETGRRSIPPRSARDILAVLAPGQARALEYGEGSALPAREFREAQADPLFRRVSSCWPKMSAEQQNSVARWCAEILERDQARPPDQAAGGAAVGLQEKAQRQPTEEKAVPNAPPTSATALAPKPAPASRAGARPRQPARTPAPGGAVPPG